MSAELRDIFTTFEELTDPRIERSRVHDLFEMVFVAIRATVAGANVWTELERFGNERLAWLRMFLRLDTGIASYDTFWRVFARLDPAGLAACIQRWFANIGRILGEAIHIDGKTLRGSFDTAARRNPLHLVSAWGGSSPLTPVAAGRNAASITRSPRRGRCRGSGEWPGLATLVMVIRTTEVDGHVSYFLSSLPTKFRRQTHPIRGHWRIENQLP